MTACQRLLYLVLVLYAATTAACGKSSTPTSPTTTTTTETVVDPTVSERFTGNLAVNGSRFYAFDVGATGTVTLTLDSVGGGAVPTTVWVGLGVGVPDGTDCSTTASLNTQSGAGPHVSATLSPGTYCARIYDVGNLAAPASFAVTIAHP